MFLTCLAVVYFAGLFAALTVAMHRDGRRWF
jgi:hypothetical protein